MLGVVGATNTTLRKILLQVGIPAPSTANSFRIDCLFNSSFTPTQLVERVPNRLRELPMINRNIVPNKLTALKIMQEAGLGDHIPEFKEGPTHEEGWIRKPYASQAGRGITTLEPGMVVSPSSGFYAQKDIKKFREFRAHVALWLAKPVFTIQEKKPKEELWNSIFELDEYQWPATRAQREKLPLTWNIESGFYFRRSTTPEDRDEKVSRFPLFLRIEELAVKAIKALGYQYGAVDILMNKERELFITEVNSHPAIKNQVSIDIYTDALIPLRQFNASMVRSLIGEVPTTNTLTFRRGGGIYV